MTSNMDLVNPKSHVLAWKQFNKLFFNHCKKQGKSYIKTTLKYIDGYTRKVGRMRHGMLFCRPRCYLMTFLTLGLVED